MIISHYEPSHCYHPDGTYVYYLNIEEHDLSQSKPGKVVCLRPLYKKQFYYVDQLGKILCNTV